MSFTLPEDDAEEAGGEFAVEVVAALPSVEEPLPLSLQAKPSRKSIPNANSAPLVGLLSFTLFLLCRNVERKPFVYYTYEVRQR